MNHNTTADAVDNHVFSVPDEADLCAANLDRIASTLDGCDPVCAANLRLAATRLRASLTADGHPVTPLCP